MSRSNSPLPEILSHDVTTKFLHARRLFRRLTGRELGFAHATRVLATFLPGWRELPVKGPDGHPMYLDLSRKEGYFNGGFSNTTGHMECLLPFVHEGDVVVDVGANIGVWSRYLLSHQQLSKLIAFEPTGRIFELLCKNLSGHPCVSCQPFALGANSGTVAFSTHLDSGQNYVLRDASRPGSRNVQMTSLDEWVRQQNLPRLDVLKIDVEGLELDVLRGAIQTLKSFAPVVYFEYMPNSSEHGKQEPESLDLLSDLGYEIRAVSLQGDLVATGQERHSSNDYIALHPRREGEGRVFG